MSQTPHRPLGEVIAGAAPSVVALEVGRTRLSGLAWRPGLVVTDEEALPDGEPEVVVPGGERVRGTVLGRDPSTDVALIRVEGAELAPADLGAPVPPVGEPVLALGCREGLPLASAGMVGFSGPAWRSLRGGTIEARIELDLDPAPGMEGGLAVGPDGRAFGMLALGPRGRAIVIPTATLERIAPRLEADGRIPRGYVGLGLRPIRIDGGGRGLLVVNVAQDGPGARAGLTQGDIVTGLDGKAVHGMRGFLGALGPDRVNTSATLAFRRGGEPREAVVSIAERPTP